VLRNRQGIPRLSRVSSRAHEGETHPALLQPNAVSSCTAGSLRTRAALAEFANHMAQAVDLLLPCDMSAAAACILDVFLSAEHLPECLSHASRPRSADPHLSGPSRKRCPRKRRRHSAARSYWRRFVVTPRPTLPADSQIRAAPPRENYQARLALQSIRGRVQLHRRFGWSALPCRHSPDHHAWPRPCTSAGSDRGSSERVEI